MDKLVLLEILDLANKHPEIIEVRINTSISEISAIETSCEEYCTEGKTTAEVLEILRAIILLGDL